MGVSSDGITNLELSQDEFRVLGYIDRRHFLNSATMRFREWKSSFDVAHADWTLRAEVQEKLAVQSVDAVKRHVGSAQGSRIRILFTGAALGSVATYFHLAHFRREGLWDLIDVEICDLLEEPLERTRKGDFDFTDETAKVIGHHDVLPPALYKQKLRDATYWQSDVSSLSVCASDRFDVSVAPYLHHHLNFIDKRLASQELERVTKPGGLCAVGDLTFDYESFSSWLKKHAAEDVPYALECFIDRDEHEKLFAQSLPVSAHDGDFYYAFIVRKEAKSQA